MIYGLTHNQDGSPRVRRTINHKLAIGLAPDEQFNYPRKLDYFVFLKKVEAVVFACCGGVKPTHMKSCQKQEARTHSDIRWVVDELLMEFYGDQCKQVDIVLIGDDPEETFRTEMAAYASNRCWCRGDGKTAQRRVPLAANNGVAEFPPKGPFQTFTGPCATGGCEYAKAKGDKAALCKPSADFTFMLKDFPQLGTVDRIHTSSFQSIGEISSALTDMQGILGRLQGVSCELYVAPDKASFQSQGATKTGTKYVLGLRVKADSFKNLLTNMAEGTEDIIAVQKRVQILPPAPALIVDEDDDERGAAIQPEFYPPDRRPDPSVEASRTGSRQVDNPAKSAPPKQEQAKQPAPAMSQNETARKLGKRPDSEQATDIKLSGLSSAILIKSNRDGKYQSVTFEFPDKLINMQNWHVELHPVFALLAHAKRGATIYFHAEANHWELDDIESIDDIRFSGGKVVDADLQKAVEAFDADAPIGGDSTGSAEAKAD